MAKLLFRVRRNKQGWRKLSRIERRLFLQAFVLMPLMIPGLRLLGLRRLQRLLMNGMPSEMGSGRKKFNGKDEVLAECQNITGMVNKAAWHNPIFSTCLHRSLVLWLLLGREGIAGDLRLGAQKTDGQFDAHAWVEYQGIVLNDTQDVQQRYAVFGAPVTETSQFHSH